MNSEINQDTLKHVLDYDPNTGIFTWKNPTCVWVKPGYLAGNILRKGYIKIQINNKTYSAHRLAWLYVHGEWPKSQIDHINGIRSNNSIGNLREASIFENARNRKIPHDNKSGFRGVSKLKDRNKWQAQIGFNRKHIHLGYFDTPEKANQVYEIKAKELFGEFIRKL